jgi:integrase
MRLTTDFLKNAVPASGESRLEVRDDDERGLVFRVTKAGARTWSVRYVNKAGDHRRKVIGPFPSIGLARAREEARKIKGAVAGGTDVVAIERQDQAAAKLSKQRTVSGAGDAYFADAALGLHKPNSTGPKRPRTMLEERRIFDRLVVPEFGSTPLADLRRADIQAFVSSVSKESAANGRFCRNVIRQILSYAVWKELLDNNPARGVGAVAAGRRERVLADVELKTIWQACERPLEVDGLALTPEMAMGVQLAMLTLTRAGESIGAAWAEIDLERALWTIPAARMKGKRTHLVPLSEPAVSLLRMAKDALGGERYVFPSRQRSGDGSELPMKATAFSRAVGRMMGTLKILDASAHDFRRTGATNLTGERVGIPRFVVSQVLAHAGDTGGAAVVTGQHYDLNDYLPDKRRALDAWGRLLQTITTDRSPNVLPLRGKGSPLNGLRSESLPA